MKTIPTNFPSRPAMLTGILAGLLLAIPVLPALADDEVRAGAVLQIPFNLSGSQPVFDPGAIRLGVTCQYAKVEEDEITMTRHVTVNLRDGVFVDSTETGQTIGVDEGDQVYGAEGNVFIEPLGDWNVSAEVLGFYGNNDIQGALGAGFGLTNGFFIDAKAMFPYSEIGVRLLGDPEIYGGIKTLGHFNSGNQYNRFTVTTTNDATTTVSITNN